VEYKLYMRKFLFFYLISSIFNKVWPKKQYSRNKNYVMSGKTFSLLL
jgi:hypothetical protein